MWWSAEHMWRSTCWRNPVWCTRSITRGEGDGTLLRLSAWLTSSWVMATGFLLGHLVRHRYVDHVKVTGSISVLLIGLRWHSQTSPWWGALSAIGPPRDDTALALLICCSANDALLCRNYHVFYYLLAGASEEERKSFHLLKPEEYHYLNQVHQPKQTTFTSSSVTPASVYAARRDVISIVVVLYVRNFSCFCVLSNPDCYKAQPEHEKWAQRSMNAELLVNTTNSSHVAHMRPSPPALAADVCGFLLPLPAAAHVLLCSPHLAPF